MDHDDLQLPPSVERTLRFLDEANRGRRELAVLSPVGIGGQTEAFAARFAPPVRPTLRLLDASDAREAMAWMVRPFPEEPEVVERIVEIEKPVYLTPKPLPRSEPEKPPASPPKVVERIVEVERRVYLPLPAPASDRGASEREEGRKGARPKGKRPEAEKGEPTKVEATKPASPSPPFAGMDDAVRRSVARLGVANVGVGSYLAGLSAETPAAVPPVWGASGFPSSVARIAMVPPGAPRSVPNLTLAPPPDPTDPPAAMALLPGGSQRRTEDGSAGPSAGSSSVPPYAPLASVGSAALLPATLVSTVVQRIMPMVVEAVRRSSGAPALAFSPPREVNPMAQEGAVAPPGEASAPTRSGVGPMAQTGTVEPPPLWDPVRAFAERSALAATVAEAASKFVVPSMVHEALTSNEPIAAPAGAVTAPASPPAPSRLPDAQAARLGQVSLVAPDLRLASPATAAAGTAVAMPWEALAKGAGALDEATLARMGSVLPAGARLVYPALPPNTAGAANLALSPTLVSKLTGAYGSSPILGKAEADQAARAGKTASPGGGGAVRVKAEIVPTGLPAATGTGGLLGPQANTILETGNGPKRGGSLDFLGVPVSLAPSLAHDPGVRREQSLARAVAGASGGKAASPEAFRLLRQKLLPSISSVTAEPDLPAWSRRANDMGLRESNPAALLSPDARAPRTDGASQPQIGSGQLAQAVRPFTPALVAAEAAGALGSRASRAIPATADGSPQQTAAPNTPKARGGDRISGTPPPPFQQGQTRQSPLGDLARHDVSGSVPGATPERKQGRLGSRRLDEGPSALPGIARTPWPSPLGADAASPNGATPSGLPAVHPHASNAIGSPAAPPFAVPERTREMQSVLARLPQTPTSLRQGAAERLADGFPYGAVNRSDFPSHRGARGEGEPRFVAPGEKARSHPSPPPWARGPFLASHPQSDHSPTSMTSRPKGGPPGSGLSPDGRPLPPQDGPSFSRQVPAGIPFRPASNRVPWDASVAGSPPRLRSRGPVPLPSFPGPNPLGGSPNPLMGESPWLPPGPNAPKSSKSISPYAPTPSSRTRENGSLPFSIRDFGKERSRDPRANLATDPLGAVPASSPSAFRIVPTPLPANMDAPGLHPRLPSQRHDIKPPFLPGPSSPAVVPPRGSRTLNRISPVPSVHATRRPLTPTLRHRSIPPSIEKPLGRAALPPPKTAVGAETLRPRVMPTISLHTALPSVQTSVSASDPPSGRRPSYESRPRLEMPVARRTGSPARVQRVSVGTSAASPAPRSVAASKSAPVTTAVAGNADGARVQVLAREVYSILRRRVRDEMERSRPMGRL